MTDSTLNRFIAYGTAAQRVAFTPSVPTPSSGPSQAYFWYETDTGSMYAYAASAWHAVTAAGAVADTITPQGRLTLVTATPVMTSDQTGKGTVYYTPYVGQMVPIYSGSAWVVRDFTELTLTLNSTDNVSGSLYDVFVFSNTGTLTLGTGPAWSSGTSRGTGAGTTQLTQLNGIWVNTVAITLRAGGSSLGSQAINTCTYLGTIYCTANGQTGMAYIPAAASGGSNNILGLYNAYNRLRVDALCRDNKASWTYNSQTWHASDGSNSNRVSWVDGLAQSSVQATFLNEVAPNTAGAEIGITLDSTSSAPQVSAELFSATTATGSTAVVMDAFPPQLGFHFASAMEACATAVTNTFFGGSSTPTRQAHALRVTLDM